MLLHMTASHDLESFSSAGDGQVLGSEHTSSTIGGRMLLYFPSSMVAEMSEIRASSY